MLPGAGERMVGGSQRAGAAVLGLVLLLPAVPAAGRTAEPPRPVERTDARRQLDATSRELDDLRAAVRRTNDEVGALDLQLRDAGSRLASIDAELQEAWARHGEAAAEERAAAGRLAHTDAALAEAVQDWGTHRERLADRVVHAFKHGSGTTGDVLIRGVSGANDWHEVAVTLEVVGRLASDEAVLLEAGVEATRSRAALRASAGELRADALTTSRRTAQEARRIEALRHQQRDVVDDIEERRAERTVALAALEEDVAARAILVRDLEEQVARIELAAGRVLVPVRVDLDVYGEPPSWSAGLPGAGRSYGAAIEAVAARHGLDGRLLAALVWTESGFRADAVSHAGALGLAQLMPATARGLGVDPRHPIENLEGGARYLRAQLDRFGRVDLALAAYNAGPGRVERAAGVPRIVETQLYVVRVLDRYEALRG